MNGPGSGASVFGGCGAEGCESFGPSVTRLASAALEEALDGLRDDLGLEERVDGDAEDVRGGVVLRLSGPGGERGWAPNSA